MPKSKPSDEAIAGMTWEELNGQVINAIGLMIVLGSGLIITG